MSSPTPDAGETRDDVVEAEIGPSGDALLDLVHDVLARHFPADTDGRWVTARDELVEAIHADFPLGGQFAELEVVVPLLAKARERHGQDVVVHIVGGMQVPGRLVVVDDDEATITVVKGDQQYDIALQSIAVLEGAR